MGWVVLAVSCWQSVLLAVIVLLPEWPGTQICGVHSSSLSEPKGKLCRLLANRLSWPLSPFSRYYIDMYNSHASCLISVLISLNSNLVASLPPTQRVMLCHTIHLDLAPLLYKLILCPSLSKMRVLVAISLCSAPRKLEYNRYEYIIVHSLYVL